MQGEGERSGWKKEKKRNASEYRNLPFRVVKRRKTGEKITLFVWGRLHYAFRRRGTEPFWEEGRGKGRLRLVYEGTL